MRENVRMAQTLAKQLAICALLLTTLSTRFT
jgi:hypothetical protein